MPPALARTAASGERIDPSGEASRVSAGLSRPYHDVLVVEDDLAIREALVDLLEEEGFTVAEAADGSQALRLLKRGTAGVVITDLMMPSMSGHELIRAMRSIPRLAETPVVVITATLNSGSTPPGEPVFLKPLDVDEIIRAVRAYLAMSGPG
jgi:CheY-like chemotaxis protein